MLVKWRNVAQLLHLFFYVHGFASCRGEPRCSHCHITLWRRRMRGEMFGGGAALVILEFLWPGALYSNVSFETLAWNDQMLNNLKKNQKNACTALIACDMRIYYWRSWTKNPRENRVGGDTRIFKMRNIAHKRFRRTLSSWEWLRPIDCGVTWSDDWKP